MTSPADPSDDVVDVLVIGGGVMGLFTAYQASRRQARVAVLERGRVGDPTTASYGRTRSYRRDYLEPLYTRLADEAIGLWTEFEAQTGVDVLVRCGCMNIAKSSVTPDLGSTYARRTTELMRRLGLPVQSFDAAGIEAAYPYLRADVADLDSVGGLVNLPAVTDALVTALAEVKAPVHEQVAITGLTPIGDLVRVSTDLGEFLTRSLVITAGHGTNDVLTLLPDCLLQIPITK